MEVDKIENEGIAQPNTMITALCWVKKGYAKAILETHEPGVEELEA